jgi:arginine decarboxylase
MALRDAGIESLNLVTVSSILPPNCKIIPAREGYKFLRPGQITFAVMARADTNEPHRLIAASVGAARPTNWNERHGYLYEHHAVGEMAKQAGKHAEDMALEMLATTLGLPSNEVVTGSDQGREWLLSTEIYEKFNHTQLAEGHKDGLWTTAVSVAVFTF